ncbi:glycine cleavage system aminomethyltransferase GcvT [Corynebacterium pseudotuberculosis]|uniref:glycine cleavage system aminomethyltransferase GcvT n=1 Tax=Corynebacterium pseudotuberculosis TaxID=1719 RepID=UPI00026608E7|nr:glycine cleavage system aminomethyltransferase GcvT [Corynebacterium pseudotuberculosis]AFM07770.1 glycine cleavage system aminomethyltransferase GcvT [Corynebacterium pseudotuberculosis Cp162]APG82000.1 Glycine cleavage system T protein [Corynebacterium pseudotuberculosis]
MASTLRTSPLHSRHQDLGAAFTPFGDWDMPLKYGSELEEHHAVRKTCGLFDLSHMGEIRVSGPQVGDFLDYALISQLSVLPVNKAKYSMIVSEDGGIIDDLITYRLADDEFLVVPNAGNAAVVAEELRSRAAGYQVTVADESADTALIAVQGPRSQALLLSLIDASADPDTADLISNMRYYSCGNAVIAGFSVLLARTGYTGEDGFELYISNDKAPALWDAIYQAGQDERYSLLPCGLASRDSLRLEAGMPLYGSELSRDLSPRDAGLGMLVSKKKEGDFVGKEALSAPSTHTRVLVGLASSERRAARHGAEILDGDGNVVGTVTSGQPSPTLGHPIALAYVEKELSEVGTELTADIRGKKYPFTVVSLPFYSREKN